jgi:uncharacterized membrane protein YbaN (DUF454 family)
MRKIWRDNGLSITLAAIFLSCLVCQVLCGHAAYNEELARDGIPALSLPSYLRSGHFASAVMENWESEFLQMGMYVVLTVRLRQRGSAESRPLSRAKEEERVDAGRKPWAATAGGLSRAFYARSLSIAMFSLFTISFVGHALGSWRLEEAERAAAKLPPIGFIEHVTGAQFWFESMQNWQSEFLAVLSLVILSIFLRQEDSPQSKPVDAPHSQTGA